MADLITLPEYKAFLGIGATNTRDDVQIAALLPAASRAIKLYTGRDFEVNTGTATTRSYQHDGSEMLDIDDCTSVTAVTTDAGVPGSTYDLPSDSWTVMPQDGSDVYYYLLIWGGPVFGVSPEMGFERNLDRYQMRPRQAMLSVTGTWGWPAVPDDVKLATAITVSEFLATESGGGEGLSSEAIEGWSRSWGGRGGNGPVALAIPNRARDLLGGYQRVFF